MQSDTGDGETVLLVWRTHRLREDPWRLAIVAPCIVVAGWAGASLFGWGGGVAAALVVVASVSEYLFPVKHILTSRKGSVRCLLNRAEILWSDVRRVWVTDDGVKLSPLENRSRREAYRGVFLRFGNRRQEVLDAVNTARKSDVVDREISGKQQV